MITVKLDLKTSEIITSESSISMAKVSKRHTTKSFESKSHTVLKNKKKLIIGIYCTNISKEPFKEVLSIYNQKGGIIDYLNSNEEFSNKVQEVIEYIDENSSSKVSERNQLQRLLKDVELKLIDCVVVLQLDRLSQNFDDLKNLISRFENKGTRFMSIKEKIDTESANGKFFISILDSITHLEQEHLSEKFQDTFGQLLLEKSSGGVAPFGYLYSFVTDGNYTAYTKENAQQYNIPAIKVFDKSTDEIYPGDYVRFMFDWFISYSSISKVARRLNDLSIPIPRVIQENIKTYQLKRERNHSTPKVMVITKPGFWSRTTVRDILLNPFYTGVYIWNKTNIQLNQGIDRNNWIYVDNAHEKIIDEKTYIMVTNLYNEIKKKPIANQ